MTDPLDNLEAFIRARPGINVRVVLGQPPLTDEVLTRAEAEPREAGRILAEDGRIASIDVGNVSLSGFTCFMDGMQRDKGPIYLQEQPVPIMYGYVAAVVRTRGSDRKMRTLPGFHEENKALYFSHAMAADHGISIAGIDTDKSGKPAIEHPLALVQAAHDAVSNTRNQLERSMADRWVRSGCPDWLLVDGGLNSEYGERDNIVGVTKSHGLQYLDWEEQTTVLNLKIGERSSVFIPKPKAGPRPVYSWYLRMHDSEGRDPYFGLIRVEAPKDARVLGMIDEISRWLLAERAPLALPDSRWDKMIYPIRDCEQFMKSLAPTHTSLDARLTRLGTLAGTPDH